MRLLISQHNLGKWTAHYICKKIKEFAPTPTRPFVLGLPSGSTPIDMYKYLIELNNKKLISFKNVVTFNMDEYVGLPKTHPQSYYYYMFNNFFNYIDIDIKNINILDGNAKDLENECNLYEEKIQSLGGMALLIGGVGEDGHIAFNEPSSSLNSVTRVKTLNYSTILANSRFFNNNVDLTPKLSLTIGIKTIMDANDIIILAKGINKSHAVANAIEGSISCMCPVTALQMHKSSLILADEFASYELKLKTIKYFDDIRDDYYLIEQELYNLKY
jgi:glucosamine-6-phosphate deaminase